MRGPSISCVASRSARPGSPGSSTRSATGSCGLRMTGGYGTFVTIQARIARPWPKKTKSPARRTRPPPVRPRPSKPSAPPSSAPSRFRRGCQVHARSREGRHLPPPTVSARCSRTAPRRAQGLASDVEGLARRVAALEVGPLGATATTATASSRDRAQARSRSVTSSRSTARALEHDGDEAVRVPRSLRRPASRRRRASPRRPASRPPRASPPRRGRRPRPSRALRAGPPRRPRASPRGRASGRRRASKAVVRLLGLAQLVARWAPPSTRRRSSRK